MRKSISVSDLVGEYPNLPRGAEYTYRVQKSKLIASVINKGINVDIYAVMLDSLDDKLIGEHDASKK